MDLSLLFPAVIALLMLKGLTEWWLERINARHTRLHGFAIPEAYQGMTDESTYARSVNYTCARASFNQWQILWNVCWLLFLLTSSVLPQLFGTLQNLLGHGWGAPLTIMLAFLLVGLPGLAWDWYDHFRIEEKFGFNKTTLTLWLADQLKGMLVNLVVSYPLLAALLALMEKGGSFWWLWGWAITMAFLLLMTFAGPVLLMPLFHKFTPLPEGELRTRLLELARRTRFGAAAIEVMDGSRRSTHANAFFTGFGQTRKIVLFDTLLQQLDLGELEAVLAHEIGHYKLGHIPRRIVRLAFLLLSGFALLAVLAAEPDWLRSFGFTDLSHPAPAVLFLVLLLAETLLFWLQPISNHRARRQEFEADAFACRALSTAAPLVSALRKLTVANLSNLTPHPWYSFFHYSHPTLLEREEALKKITPQNGYEK